MKPIDVFPGSSRLVEGSLPPESLLLLGPSGVGKSVFCKQFVYNGLARQESCVYVSTDESPSEIEASMKHFGFDIESYKKKGLFRIIDCYSWKLGGYSRSKFVVSNPADLTALSSTIEKGKGLMESVHIRVGLGMERENSSKVSSSTLTT